MKNRFGHLVTAKSVSISMTAGACEKKTIREPATMLGVRLDLPVKQPENRMGTLISTAAGWCQNQFQWITKDH